MPHSDFIYGIKVNKRDGGVAEGIWRFFKEILFNDFLSNITWSFVALNWLSKRNCENSHDNEQKSAYREKDYHRLNILALKSGVTDVRGQSLFRSRNDYRLPVNIRKKTVCHVFFIL